MKITLHFIAYNFEINQMNCSHMIPYNKDGEPAFQWPNYPHYLRIIIFAIFNDGNSAIK